MSVNMASRIYRNEQDLEKQIALAYQLCFTRIATRSELIQAEALYKSFYYDKEIKTKDRDERKIHSLAGVCQALFASAEFRYLN